MLALEGDVAHERMQICTAVSCSTKRPRQSNMSACYEHMGHVKLRTRFASRLYDVPTDYRLDIYRVTVVRFYLSCEIAR